MSGNINRRAMTRLPFELQPVLWHFALCNRSWDGAQPDEALAQCDNFQL